MSTSASRPTMGWQAFGIEAGVAHPVERWDGAHYVLVTNRVPLPSSASGFVPRYRALVRELIGRGPTALVLVVAGDDGAEHDLPSMAAEIATDFPGLRTVAFGEVPAARNDRSIPSVSSLLPGGRLGAFPPSGPGPDAVVVVAHKHLAPLALTHPSRRGVFLLEEAFNQYARPGISRLQRAREIAAAQLAPRLYRQIAADGRPVVVLTPTERDHFARWIEPTRIHVVPLCVDRATRDGHEQGPAASNGDAPTVGCVGRLEDLRTVLPLVEMIEASIDRTPWRWQLVGAQPDGRLLSLAARHPDRVHLTGRVDDVRPWYRDFDVVVVPAAEGITGTKTTLLQAWSEGVPCVAARASAHSAAAVDGRDTLVYDTPADGVWALERVLADPALAATLVAGGRSRDAALDCRALAVRIANLADGSADGTP